MQHCCFILNNNSVNHKNVLGKMKSSVIGILLFCMVAVLILLTFNDQGYDGLQKVSVMEVNALAHFKRLEHRSIGTSNRTASESSSSVKSQPQIHALPKAFTRNAKKSKLKKSKSTEKYVFKTLIGRLGNKLFQFATSYCIAKKTNRTYILGSSDRLLLYFPSVAAKVLLKNITLIKRQNKVKIFGEQNSNRYSAKLVQKVNIQNDTYIEIFGYLQSWKYFRSCKSDIDKALVFAPAILDQMNKFITEATYNFTMSTSSNLTSLNLTYIGIHVRRTDRSDISPPVSYFNNAINYFQNRFSYPIFLVTSDNISWCKRNIKSERKNIFFSYKPSSSVTDFAILRHCNHTILSVGTFAWFPAWLNGGTTIYYNDWLGSPKENADHYLPNWIGMNSTTSILSTQ